MSFLNEFGHPGYPEWEFDEGGKPPLCEACGYHHEPTDVCPIHEPDPPPTDPEEEEEAPLPEEPAWLAEGYATELTVYPFMPDPPALPAEIDLPPIVPDEPIVYEKPSYRYSSVLYRSDN